MKKIILLLFVLTILFVPSMAYAGETPSQSDYNIKENASYEAIENIKDETRKSKINELMFTPVSYTCFFEGEEHSDFQRPQIDYVKIINNLADLPDNEFDAEVKTLIEELVLQNQNNNNIIWTKEFKDNIVKQYCPQYQNQLNTELLVEPTNPINWNSLSRAKSTSGSDTQTAVARCESLGNELFTLKCKVNWSWENNKLTSVKGTPSYHIKSARYSWGGYSNELEIVKDSFSATLYLQGHFIEQLGGIPWKHRYAHLSIAVNKDGGFSYTDFITD